MKVDKTKIGLNFWTIHPQLKLLGEFKNLYDADKSKGKEKSSALMWAIFLIYDPDSEFFNFELQDKVDMVSKDFLTFKFKESDYKEIISFYTANLMTAAKRQLYVWNRKLDEKTNYLETLTYETDSEIIEKLLASNKKLYDDYEAISKRMEQEQSGVVKGGAEESLSEQGTI